MIILFEEYIDECIIPSRRNSNYGYLWWLGEGYFAAHGFGGQNITVVPKENKIIVIQATPTSRGKEYEDIVNLFISL